jgi:DNA-directed RNA polymerase sigma subunit (sigma70/sigma32)
MDEARGQYRRVVNQVMTTNLNQVFSSKMALAGFRRLNPIEEKVLRMSLGIKVDPEQNLDRIGENFPGTKAFLKYLEARAIASSGDNGDEPKIVD